jgi:hypothetical protein
MESFRWQFFEMPNMFFTTWIEIWKKHFSFSFFLFSIVLFEHNFIFMFLIDIIVFVENKNIL